MLLLDEHVIRRVNATQEGFDDLVVSIQFTLILNFQFLCVFLLAAALLEEIIKQFLEALLLLM